MGDFYNARLAGRHCCTNGHKADSEGHRSPIRRSLPSRLGHCAIRPAVVGSLWIALLAPLAHAAPVVEDTMAQRMQACTGCHGPQGRAASDGYYPRIAGKPAGYLYNQLRSFRDGRRHYALMNNLLAPLTDQYLREIAAHFAGLDVAYPAPTLTTVDAAAMTRGEALVKRGDAALDLPACVQCHGSALMGVKPAVPALIGMPRDYLNGQLGAWRTGNRRATAPDCMAQIAMRLGPNDIGAISQWLSSQPVPIGAKPALALPLAMPIACGGLDSLQDVESMAGGQRRSAAKP